MTCFVRRLLTGLVLAALLPAARAATVQVALDGLPPKLTESVLATLDIGAESQRERVSLARIRRAHNAAARQIRAARSRAAHAA